MKAYQDTQSRNLELAKEIGELREQLSLGKYTPDADLPLIERVAMALLDKLVKMDVPLDVGADITTLAKAAIAVMRPTKRESGELERITNVIKNFWDLHSIEPSTGFTPQQLAMEILK